MVPHTWGLKRAMSLVNHISAETQNNRSHRQINKAATQSCRFTVLWVSVIKSSNTENTLLKKASEWYRGIYTVAERGHQVGIYYLVGLDLIIIIIASSINRSLWRGFSGRW